MTTTLSYTLTRFSFLFTGLIIIVLCYFGYENVAATVGDPSPLAKIAHTSNTQTHRVQSERVQMDRVTPEPVQIKHSLLDDTMNATLGFEKIFIINLATRTDRRDAFTLAAAFVGLQVEAVDAATKVDDKAWPPGPEEYRPNPGGAGAWRSHMNVLRDIVDKGISSAIIMEDDVDWDIRVKSQMRTYARASRLLMQPLEGTTDEFLDPTYPHPSPGNEETKNFHLDEETVSEPTSSPYGDLQYWDVLWLGHCGVRFPWKDDKSVPLGRVVIPNDPTVPAKKHIDVEFGSRQYVDEYPEHTRVVSRAHTPTCTVAYAVSQAGARRILWEMGLKAMRGPYDLQLREACAGHGGRSQLLCFTSQPQIFGTHRPAGDTSRWSNISPQSDLPTEEVKDPYTTNVRWSTQSNFGKLVNGETDFVEYPKPAKKPEKKPEEKPEEKKGEKKEGQ
ncbi:unnamed protein product [Zymoseptoria tritici ST99CH_1A5]|uniref:Glycosyltransferase family 25 protein n=3 Tax=Zymoseptoria tritici TaxID=1047171 RepID=F9XJ71_ZYMTI|nr:uncharacterized protein MYCGRDRAFT_75366 [Zymoseptoria tritici IPO323]EGP84767.1 hypothetical protein MYCGRDRAFT_75366 [Zymoseptoria tritici IPO323]SMR58335.1 unnamed protein product [Zymoseptoria tritici ST99CH_1E4]SMY27535.1 unnamed protein product [Zymoseptoria tritici ST99CH_1A5]